MLLPVLLLATPVAMWCAPLVAAGATAVNNNPASRRASRAPGAKLVDSPALSGLTDAEADVAMWLASDEMGQAHLLAGWESAAPADKRRLIEQVVRMDKTYPEDAQGRSGLSAYVAHARDLLAESAAGKNPFEGCSAEVPDGENMEVGSDAFRADERLGMQHIQNAAFVLVAGGLGERLGYDGIKVELPTETLTCASFLQTYITSLLAMQRKYDTSRPVPLVIMTSADTHEKTVSLLEANDYFGMPREQLHFITQSNVPAVNDNDGGFALVKDDAFALQTKPHGHGDVHTLLHTSGLLPKLQAEGRTHLIFFQDTNVLAFKAIPAALGVSVRRNLAMNSLAVPRSPGEAAGAICKLVRADAPPLVINVEYNQLEPLLQAAGGGDVPDASGYSPYPGNVNTLIFELAPYAAALQATGGSMPEFVNPKYANAEKTTFKKPTRLECMMQDFPKLLTPDVGVGFTAFERWFSFSPVKNSIAEAIASHEKGVYAASPGAGEAAVYEANARLLRLAGCNVASDVMPSEFLGLPLNLGPAIALTPNFALTVDEVIRRCVGGEAVRISGRSSLVLDGDITLHSLTLDGALSILACDGASVSVRECSVSNAGWPFAAVEPGTPPKGVSIRGYNVGDRTAGLQIEVTEPGQYELGPGGELTRIE
jgi:UDP-sugar pyrophosphorylase